MKKKIKNWIIRKLGGIVYEDLPERIRKEIFSHLVYNTIDKHLADTLCSGFDTQMRSDKDDEYCERVLGDFKN